MIVTETVAVVLRKALLVSIDGLLALAIGLEPMAHNGSLREFLNPEVSRSGLNLSPPGSNR